MAGPRNSKAFHAFEQKLIFFYDDIEIMDVIRTSVLDGKLSDDGSPFVLSGVVKEKHTHLSRRKNSVGGRQITINHLRSTLYSSFIKDLYEEVTDYLKLILFQASKNHFDTGRIVGEHGFKVEAKTVLALGNWTEVCRFITEAVFQSLESERSTLSLLKKMCTKLGLSVDEKYFNAAMPYLEVRHLLVHAGGRLNDDYRSKYPFVKESAGFVFLDYGFVENAYHAILALVQAFDAEVVDKKVLHSSDLSYSPNPGA